MNTTVKTLLTGLAAFAAGAALVFCFTKVQPKAASGGGGDGDEAAAANPNPVQLKQSAIGQVIISLNAGTQDRLGLKTEALAPGQWQDGVAGYGTVLDPAALAAAAADYETARATAAASGREYERLKKLAGQDNVSAHALETAELAAQHDELALDSARAKFIADWGKKLAASLDASGGSPVTALARGTESLVRLELPAGERLPEPPGAARVALATDETNRVDAEFFDTATGVDPQTQGQAFFFLVKDRLLPPNAAVDGELLGAGPPQTGLIVPAAAVLRYEGLGWVYVQTGTNDFTREKVPLDRPAPDGWFVFGKFSPADRVVVSGAQSVLSAELSGGDFTTGERD